MIAQDATDEERLLVLASFAAPTGEERAELGALAGRATRLAAAFRARADQCHRAPALPAPCE